jgi:hypothetical protein
MVIQVDFRLDCRRQPPHDVILALSLQSGRIVP